MVSDLSYQIKTGELMDVGQCQHLGDLQPEKTWNSFAQRSFSRRKSLCRSYVFVGLFPSYAVLSRKLPEI